jgi:hypothetical protein
MIGKAAFFLLLSCALHGGANAQTLWNGISAGMSADDVRRAIPSAYVLPATEQKTRGDRVRLMSSAPELIDGTSYRPGYTFKSGRLAIVELSAEDVYKGAITFGTFERVRDLLRARYGKEIEARSGHGISETKWIANGVVVALWFVDFELSNQRAISISYEAVDVGKL